MNKNSPNEMTLGASQATEAASDQDQTSTRQARRGKSQHSSEQDESQKKQSRRGLLRKGLEAALATVGTGALLGMETGTSLAHVHPNTTISEASSGSTPGVTSSTASPATAAAILATSSVASAYAPAVMATGTGGAYGISASSDTSYGVYSTTSGTTNAAIYGVSTQGGGSGGSGVIGESKDYGCGVYGKSMSGTGVAGTSLYKNGVSGSTADPTGLYAGVSGSNTGVGYGVYGTTASSSAAGVYGNNSYTGSGWGGYGVYGYCSTGSAVYGKAPGAYGYGVTGVADGIQGIGVLGAARGPGGYAGYFENDVAVVGNLSKSGGSFKIDHPQDPAHKYLYHSFVESPDMKNIYDGVVILDAYGEAEVHLPSWFDALNSDFRYQLTCIGGYAPVYIAEEISSKRFKIAGGKAGMKVSWQVTGIRQDAWANAHRIPVEEDKPAEEQGRYLHPELYGESSEEGIGYIRLPKPILPEQPD